MYVYYKNSMSPSCVEVFEYLSKRPRNLTLSKIAIETNIQLSWLKLFSRGKSIDPSVGKIDALKAYFDNATKA